MRTLLARQAWVFDLDGTLADVGHDFPGLKRRLGLDPSQPLMEGLEALPEPRRTAAWSAVAAWEVAHAETAVPVPGAVALLEALTERDRDVGILTRNTRETALRTLEVSGLASFVSPAHVLGRNCAAPKPEPDGVRLLLARFGASPDQAVMVGDAEHDVVAGERAGTSMVRVAPPGTPSVAPWVLSDLRPLAELFA